MAESKRALELEPLQLVVGIHLGWHYLYARQYDQAIEQFRNTLDLDPAFPQADYTDPILLPGTLLLGFRGFFLGKYRLADAGRSQAGAHRHDDTVP